MKQKKSAVPEKPRKEPSWLFPHGSVFWTPGVIREVPLKEAALSVARHLSGDWGELDPFDWRQNDLALEFGGRLFSAYETEAGLKFWIITEADRSSTTILLTGED